MSFDEGLTTNPTLENKRNDENINFSFDDNPPNIVNNNSFEEVQNKDFIQNNISFSENINEAQNVSFQDNKPNNQEYHIENRFNHGNNQDRINISFQANNINNISFENKLSQTNDEDNICLKNNKLVNDQGEDISEIVNTPQKQSKSDNDYLKNFTFGNSKYKCKTEINENELRNENLYFLGNINNISFEEPIDKNNINHLNNSYDENTKNKYDLSNDKSKLYKEIINRTNISTDDSTIICQNNLIKKNFIFSIIKFHINNLERILKININLKLSFSFGAVKTRLKDLDKEHFKRVIIKSKLLNSFETINNMSQNFFWLKLHL